MKHMSASPAAYLKPKQAVGSSMKYFPESELDRHEEAHQDVMFWEEADGPPLCGPPGLREGQMLPQLLGTHVCCRGSQAK